jgi:hypothetical protein
MPTTTNYGITIPTPGASYGTWGSILNTALDAIDAQMYSNDQAAAAAQATADAALPKAGGVMTGRVDLLAARNKFSALGNIGGGTETIDVSAAEWFTATVTDDVTIEFSNVPAVGAGYVTTVALFLVAGGAHAVTWGETIFWPGGTAPALTESASSSDLIFLTTFNGGTSWHGVYRLDLRASV